jgi:hypothetical protein
MSELGKSLKRKDKSTRVCSILDINVKKVKAFRYKPGMALGVPAG